MTACLVEPWVSTEDIRLCLGLFCDHDHGYGLFNLGHSSMLDVCLGGRASHKDDFSDKFQSLSFLCPLVTHFTKPRLALNSRVHLPSPGISGVCHT